MAGSPPLTSESPRLKRELCLVSWHSVLARMQLRPNSNRGYVVDNNGAVLLEPQTRRPLPANCLTGKSDSGLRPMERLGKSSAPSRCPDRALVRRSLELVGSRGGCQGLISFGLTLLTSVQCGARRSSNDRLPSPQTPSHWSASTSHKAPILRRCCSLGPPRQQQPPGGTMRPGMESLAATVGVRHPPAPPVLRAAAAPAGRRLATRGRCLCSNQGQLQCAWARSS